jgi:hypothetical protein
MMELPKGETQNCEWFLNALETIPADGPGSATPERLLTKLPERAREHAAHCAHCQAVIADFAETRQLFDDLARQTPEPGPWFTRRVMNSITAQEHEREERQEGFWISVRRLAPRLVALATLLLMLGGTWAFQERRAARTRTPEMGPAEGIFESVPSTPANDDIIASTYQEQSR